LNLGDDDAMSPPCRRYLVNNEVRIVRLESRMFERLVSDPQHTSMPDRAGQRALVAEIVAAVCDRVPVRGVRRLTADAVSGRAAGRQALVASVRAARGLAS
jgi:hypothetical protein